MKKTKLFTATLLLLSVLNLHAAFEAGQKEININLSVDRASNEYNNSTTVQGELFYGYFQNENLEWIGGLSILNNSNNTTPDLYGVLAGARWHFTKEGSYTPFIGGRIGFERVDFYWGEEENEFSFGIEGGIRQKLSDNITIDYIASYNRANELKIDHIGFKIGFGIFF